MRRSDILTLLTKMSFEGINRNMVVTITGQKYVQFLLWQNLSFHVINTFRFHNPKKPDAQNNCMHVNIGVHVPHISTYKNKVDWNGKTELMY